MQLRVLPTLLVQPSRQGPDHASSSQMPGNVCTSKHQAASCHCTNAARDQRYAWPMGHSEKSACESACMQQYPTPQECA